MATVAHTIAWATARNSWRTGEEYVHCTTTVAQLWFRIKPMALDPADLDIVILRPLRRPRPGPGDRPAHGGRRPRRRATGAYGFVFQHLVDGPRSISALAERLGVTQQAASKTVAEMEAAGFLDQGGAIRATAASRRSRSARRAAARSRPHARPAPSWPRSSPSASPRAGWPRCAAGCSRRSTPPAAPRRSHSGGCCRCTRVAGVSRRGARSRRPCGPRPSWRSRCRRGSPASENATRGAAEWWCSSPRGR